MRALQSLKRDYGRPTLILFGVTALFLLADGGRGRFASGATLFSELESFATSGVVALGLGMTMIAGEFDISVVGVYSLAGCIAVLTGDHYPYLGALLAIAAGASIGALQGVLISRLRLSSVAITLGGMLTCNGLASVLTGNQSIAYGNMNVALGLATPLIGPFTIRSIIAFALFFAAAGFVAFTRPGRDLIAIGSNRKGAATAGAPVARLIILIFTFSGACAALSGALISYSLASASPSGLSDVILPAAAAAILGGVSLGGGSGRPLGIMLGVLALACLQVGFNALGSPPFVNDVAMGAVLLAVGIIDAPDLARKVKSLSLAFRETRPVARAAGSTNK